MRLLILVALVLGAPSVAAAKGPLAGLRRSYRVELADTLVKGRRMDAVGKFRQVALGAIAIPLVGLAAAQSPEAGLVAGSLLLPLYERTLSRAGWRDGKLARPTKGGLLFRAGTRAGVAIRLPFTLATLGAINLASRLDGRQSVTLEQVHAGATYPRPKLPAKPAR